MAIETHNVTPEDVLDDLPGLHDYVTQNSDGVSDARLEDWIEEAAGQINAILRRHGIDPGSLEVGDDERALVRAGIKAYAAARASMKMAMEGSTVTMYLDTWQDVRETLRETPQDMGDAQASASQIHSNVDTNDPTEKSWDSDNFGGW